MSDTGTEPVYHGVMPSYASPPGAEVFVRALCPCNRQHGPDDGRPLVTVNL